MTYEQIRAAILGRMLAFTGINQKYIDYQNPKLRFTPPETGIWCRPNIQFATAFMAGMADRPYTRKPGLITIQCFDAGYARSIALVKLADALEDHFSYWTTGDLETLEASLVDVRAGAMLSSPTGSGYYQINITIPFRAG